MSGKTVFEGCSKVGIGFMRMEPNTYGYQYYQDLIDYAIDRGVNYFESCYFYQEGFCDKFSHNLLKKYDRKSYNLANKMPIHGFLDRGVLPQKIFAEQLNAHATSYFDYYLVQALDAYSLKVLKNSYCLEYLHSKKSSGNIKFLGFSFHDNEVVLREVLDLYPWDFAQIQLNYLDYYNGVAKKLLGVLKSRGIPFITMCATKGTLLENDGELPSKCADLIPNEKRTATALSFCDVMGSSIILRDLWTTERMKDNLNILKGNNFINGSKAQPNQWSASGGVLPMETLKRIASLYAKETQIPCTGCGYCLDSCPKNINIKDIFLSYNSAVVSDSIEKYARMVKGEKSYRDCIRCGNCVRRCPQHLNIPELFNTTIFQLRY